MTNPVRAGLFGWLFRYGLFALLATALLIVASGRALYRHFDGQLPDLSTITEYSDRAPGVSRIHDRDGAVLAILAREHRAYAPIEEIPETLQHAFIAAEDRRFLEHSGVDLRGIARAVLVNYRAGTIAQGGSTITQQVAKSFLGNEQTLERKLKEAILAVRLESRLRKEEILEIYLNKIFLGSGAYGVRAAAARYFDKPLDELTTGESALLAGLARAPSRDHPRRNIERAKNRRDVVLQAMAAQGFISANEYERRRAEEITLAKTAWDPFRWRLPYYAEYVRKRLSLLFGEDAALLQTLQVETFADALASAYARDSMIREISALDRRQGWRGPVAHLEREEHRETFLDRTRRAYGLTPLRAEDRWYLGLVEDVRARDAMVRVGSVLARMTLLTTSWAAPYDTRSGTNNQSTASL
ncbi:MAG: transglycosylase domain-containing protein, partial [Nannocystaceae bacterium]